MLRGRGRHFIYNFFIQFVLAILTVHKRIISNCAVIGGNENIRANRKNLDENTKRLVMKYDFYNI